MADDDVVDDIGVIEGVKFAADDSTVSIPFPARHVFIVPKGLESIQLWSLPHPRHSEPSCYLTGTCRGGDHSDNEQPKYVLCEVQERRHSFGDMWFLGEHVEPSSALNIATPIDVAFFAVALARKGGHTSEKFVAAEDIIARDPIIAALPAPIVHSIEGALRHVCEVKSLGPGETYFRFSEDVFRAWVRRKHEQLLSGKALASLLGIEVDAEQQQLGAETQLVLKSKGLALLNEYLHASLHDAAAAACGVAAADVVAPSPAAPRGATHHADAASSEPDAKKPRVELKSASVKRLEKAGPPKGTPTLMAMFAKKKQQQDPAI
jgi:hypothetical protein